MCDCTPIIPARGQAAKRYWITDAGLAWLASHPVPEPREPRALLPGHPKLEAQVRRWVKR